MGGRDQIDIVTANFLKVQHHIGQVFIADYFSATFVGNWPILTENTSQIAVGEKYGAGTVPADQGFLFAVVGICRIEDQFG
jgi:hypothetical protein